MDCRTVGVVTSWRMEFHARKPGLVNFIGGTLEMKERRELENIRGLLEVGDTIVGNLVSTVGMLVFLWVVIVFPAALIVGAWPWISSAWAWLRELLTFA